MKESSLSREARVRIIRYFETTDLESPLDIFTKEQSKNPSLKGPWWEGLPQHPWNIARALLGDGAGAAACLKLCAALLQEAWGIYDYE